MRKGFSVEQLRECLDEYADLSVVQVCASVLSRVWGGGGNVCVFTYVQHILPVACWAFTGVLATLVRNSWGMLCSS